MTTQLSIIYICVIAIYTHLGPNYIRPNQSYLYSFKRQQKLLKQEHQNTKNTITSYLVRVHHMPNSSPIIKQFIQEMEPRLYQRYMAPISYRDIYRARNELKLIKSIESKLRKGKWVVPPEISHFIQKYLRSS